MSKIAICPTVFIRQPEAYQEAIKTIGSFKSKKHQLDWYFFETECPENYRNGFQTMAKGYFYNDKNILSRSWNKAIKLVFDLGYDYCIVPNLDIELHNGCLDTLVEFAEHNKGLVYSPYCINHPELEVPKKTYLVRPEGHLDWNTFACFMVRKEFLDMGGFDENFIPCYAEDVDMGYRMQLLGKKHWCVRDAEFSHYLAISISLGATDILKEKESNAEKYFEYKWGGRARSQIYKTPFNKDVDINYWSK